MNDSAVETYAFCAMVQIETDDPRLTERALADSIGTAAGVARMRKSVLHHMPRDITRLIAVLPVEQARHLMMLHEAIGHDLGVEIALYPPASYVPPTRG